MFPVETPGPCSTTQGVLNDYHARFYISEMFAVVNGLYKLVYTHWDLKPEVWTSTPPLRMRI